MILKHLWMPQLQCQIPPLGQFLLTLHTHKSLQVFSSSTAITTDTVVSTQPCSLVQASFHRVTSLQALLHFLPSPTCAFAVIPTHYGRSCTIPGLSDFVHWYLKPSLKTILLSVSADPTPPAACPQHTLCLSQGTALQGKQQPGCTEMEQHPPSPTSPGASSIPVHTSALHILPCKSACRIRLCSLSTCLFHFADFQAELCTCCSPCLSNYCAVKCLASDLSLTHQSRSSIEALIGHILRQIAPLPSAKSCQQSQSMSIINSEST